MKWINDPATFGNRPLLALEPQTAKAIAKLLTKARSEAVKRYEHYNGLFEAGEATDRQTTLMAQYQDTITLIDNFTEAVK